jgi:DNA-binding Lrp family transcriptional regulator
MQKLAQTLIEDPIPYRADEIDRQLISLTQAGLPLTSRPYASLARQLGISEIEVIQRLENMLQLGIIRRMGAVPNHYKLGYRANGMSVWDVTDNQVDKLGKLIGELEFVTHCYQRPRHLPVWPYNLFAMVHAKTREEAMSYVAIISALLGDACRQHDVLFSQQILKKTGLRIKPKMSITTGQASNHV